MPISTTNEHPFWLGVATRDCPKSQSRVVHEWNGGEAVSMISRHLTGQWWKVNNHLASPRVLWSVLTQRNTRMELSLVSFAQPDRCLHVTVHFQPSFEILRDQIPNRSSELYPLSHWTYFKSLLFPWEVCNQWQSAMEVHAWVLEWAVVDSTAN